MLEGQQPKAKLFMKKHPYLIISLLLFTYATPQQSFCFPGLGMGGNGRGSRHNQNQNQQQKGKEDSDSDKVPSEDSAVLAPTPPPENAKVLTKVGWCEVQVFGHTFSDIDLMKSKTRMKRMHLEDRLAQLNAKVHFEPGKPAVKLMDDIDALVAFVYNKKKSGALQQASTTESTP